MIDLNEPYKVTEDKCIFSVVDVGQIPRWFTIFAQKAMKKVALRITGGCKGMDQSAKQDMLKFFAEGALGYVGFASSGASREVSDGKIDPMVTDVPGVIAALNPGCIALSTLPRVGAMALVENSRMVVGQYDTAPNPSVHGFLIVEENVNEDSDWDGDLSTYFKFMRDLVEYNGFTRAGACSWNGGGITADEIIQAAKLSWPSILVKGSGRVTDEIIEYRINGRNEMSFEDLKGNHKKGLDELPDDHSLIVVDRDDPKTLRKALIVNGFIDE